MTRYYDYLDIIENYSSISSQRISFCGRLLVDWESPLSSLVESSDYMDRVAFMAGSNRSIWNFDLLNRRKERMDEAPNRTRN